MNQTTIPTTVSPKGIAPRVSVILPTHNRPQLFSEALGSVLSQSIPDFEVVVIDDASEPPVDPLPWQRESSHVVWLRNDRCKGGAAGKAAGTHQARGEILAYLDDDDLLDPSYLESATAVLRRNPHVDVVFMGVNWFGSGADFSARIHNEAVREIIDECKPTTAEPDLLVFGRELFRSLLRMVPMPFQRPVVRRAAIERIGMHRPGCLLWDCDWALRAALTSRCALLNKPLYQQRDDNQGYHSKPGRELAQMESALEMTEYLLRNPPPGTDVHDIALLRKAASRNALNVAYHLSRAGSLAPSVRAWWTGQLYEINFNSFKIPAAALLFSLLSLVRKN